MCEFVCRLYANEWPRIGAHVRLLRMPTHLVQRPLRGVTDDKNLELAPATRGGGGRRAIIDAFSGGSHVGASVMAAASPFHP